MKTFIVATDFSINAQYASAFGVQLAKQLDARIILMHAYTEPVAISEYELECIHYNKMKRYIHERLDERKQELYQTFGHDVKIECIAYNDHLIHNIHKLYQERDARLVIIGLTGGGMANYFLGANTLNIVTDSRCMVLTVPPTALYRPVKKVIFACDMKEVETTVPVEKIKRVLQVLNAELLILNIRQAHQQADELEQEKGNLKKVLQGINFSFHQSTNKQLVAGIKDFVREQEADLVIIIPKKHSSFTNILRTNHTKRMLFRSAVPILTIPADY